MFPAQRYQETLAEKRRREVTSKVREASRALRGVPCTYKTALPIATRAAILHRLGEVQERLAEIDEMLRGATEREACS